MSALACIVARSKHCRKIFLINVHLCMNGLAISEEAGEIEQIQKGILAVSEKEKPFDVFICCKEKDETGKRTSDSVLAEEIYKKLTEEHFRVFLARIALRDKAGTAYEPYIYAALNSARIMVVVGTKAEYVSSVWVKNEWSRYLALMRKGENKVLIPAYRDMVPQEFPDELAYLQAMDMDKLGFMQDLIQRIKKVVSPPVPVIKQETPQKTVVTERRVQYVQADTQAMLDRAFICLQYSEWEPPELRKKTLS